MGGARLWVKFLCKLEIETYQIDGVGLKNEMIFLGRKSSRKNCII
uniref:Uncharacterized protein n=1 Tax=Arundo donax TaxID=35708 RepID=A0A0A8ZBS3_ARUDO